MRLRTLLASGWWHKGWAAAFTCLLLAVSGLLYRPVSPVKTIVSITFDDGYADQYDAASMLYLKGMTGTFYIITGKVGQPGYLTWDQMREMQAIGNEIGGHTITHPDLRYLQGYALRHEICDGRAALVEHGFRVTSFAYTYGDFDEITRQTVIDCGYNSARMVQGKQETYPPLDPYQLRTMDAVESGTTQAQLRGYVKQAERAGGGWVQIVFHHVCDGCDPYAITPFAFNSFLSWLRDREPDGTVVRTIDQVIGGPVAPVVHAASSGGGTSFRPSPAVP